MTALKRPFLAKYSRILRKKLAIKLLVNAVMRSLASSARIRGLFHIYVERVRAEDIAHVRLDPGEPAEVVLPIDAAMEAHLRRYAHGLDGCLEPGRLRLRSDVRAYELRDCDILPWLGFTVHRPTGRIIVGGADAQPFIVTRVHDVGGLVYSLVDEPRGHKHYFHFFEKLTLLLRALRWAPRGEPVTLLVRKALSSYQKAAIEALTREHGLITVVAVEEHEIVRPERLVVITRQPAPIICWFALAEEWREIGAMLRRFYGACDGRAERNVYLSRRRQRVRRLANEKALAPILARFGYEQVTPDDLPHADQVRLMTQTRRLLSVEGAGLTNMIFADKPIRVIMMLPWSILNPLWEGLALALGHEFRYVESGGAMWNDAFTVDPAALEAALAE